MNSDELLRENQALRERLSRLSQASRRINESLDFDTVLQDVVDSARALTASRYGAITVLGEAGQRPDFIVSGLTPEEHQGLWEMPQGLGFFEYLSGLTTPLRLANITGYLSALGMGEFVPPVSASSLLVAPIRHRGAGVGTIYLAHETEGREFSQDDEETLTLFASQAALVIANSRRYREEQRARNDLETLVNTSPVGVVVFDARTGTPLSFNREAMRIVDGLRDPDQAAEQLLDVVSFRRADGREVSLSDFPLARALGTGETVRAEEIVISVPGGRSVTVLINATPILSEEGAIETVVVTLQDLTPLEEIERQRAEFLGTVSHELRAPLTSIKGSAAALLRAPSTLDAAESQQFLRIIDGQADHILDLIGELLDAARIDAGVLSVSPEPSDPSVLVDRAVGLFQTSEGRSNVSIDLRPDLPRVLADRRRVEQVLTNLLANAARHSPESSVIRVSAAMEGVHVAVSVADHGVGVSAERLPYLFRRFFRAEGDQGDGVGAGLGLAVCKGIVEAHGGRIRAESDGPGRGATFTFTLPAAEEMIAILSDREQGGRQGVRVLAVDDDAQALRFVRDALTEAGYQVTATGDPQEALRLMEREQPRLVLMDLALPGSDGIELMQDILRIADVPVIFLSGYGQDRVIVRAFEMGADDYIVKPFSPTELAARVRAALRRRTGPARMAPSEPYVRGDLTIDYAQRMVSVAGQPVRLTAIEYEFLRELSVHAGRVLTHQHLLQRVWGKTEPQTPRTIRTHLMRLRRKLGEDAENPRYIFAEPRVGYRMERPDARASE
ncbi:MAG: response regulator [Chloroflexi bacterium]|nr:response regulator [Chloroflexota bacterium]